MKIQINIPTTWNQCTDSQLNQLATLMHSAITGLKFDYRCFLILASVKWWQFLLKAKLIIVTRNVTMSELKKTFGFIYESNTLTRFPAINVQYFAPLPQISNLTIGEMAVADDLHIKFRNTRNEEYLHYLAATLYVSQKQPRPPFDKNDLPEKVKHFEKLPLAELLVIEQSFHGCKEHLAKTFKTVFPKSQTQSQPQSQPKSSQFPKLILELSGGKFGTHAETSRTNCYTFLAEFENLLKQKPL